METEGQRARSLTVIFRRKPRSGAATGRRAVDEKTLFTLMVDLHRDGARQGPGSDEETLRALE